MIPRICFKHPAFGILSGLVALTLVLAFVVIHKRANLQLFSFIVAVVFFLAGVLRGASDPKNPLLNMALIGLGGVLPVYVKAVAGTAFSEQRYLPWFFAFSLLLTVAGVETSHLFARGWRKTAVLLALLSFTGTMLAIRIAVGA